MLLCIWLIINISSVTERGFLWIIYRSVSPNFLIFLNDSLNTFTWNLTTNRWGPHLKQNIFLWAIANVLVGNTTEICDWLFLVSPCVFYIVSVLSFSTTKITILTILYRFSRFHYQEMCYRLFLVSPILYRFSDFQYQEMCDWLFPVPPIMYRPIGLSNFL